MNSLISIIIPVYNVEQYLKQCIDSVINQTYKNLEIILIDDGSTDSSGKICDEYGIKDKRIKVIHKVNGGVSSARNAGLKIAKGEYIGFVDSDDYIDFDMYETLYNKIISTNTDVVVCDRHNWGNNICSKNNKYINERTTEYLYNCAAVCTRMFKKSVIKNIFFDEQIDFGEDRLFYLEVYKKTTKVSCCLSAKYYYRNNLNSITNNHKFKKNYVHFLDILDLEIDFVKQKNLFDLAEKLYMDQLNISTSWLRFIALEKNPDVESAKILLNFIKKNIINFLKAREKFNKKCFVIIACINFNLASKIYKLLNKIFEI